MIKKRFNKKFSNIMGREWYKYNIIAITVAIILVSCLSVGYAVLLQNLEVQGYATLRADKDIRITNITNTFSSCGTDEFNPRYSENSITINGIIPELSCTLNYTVTIRNNAEYIVEITHIDDTIYNNTSILYAFDDLNIGTRIPANSEKVVELTLYYNPALTVLPENTSIGAVFVFEFTQASLASNEIEYVTDGLVLLYDGNNNTGTGYDSNTNEWKDLVGTNDGSLSGNPTWEYGYLKFDGIDDLVTFVGTIPANYTIIATFNNDSSSSQNYQRIYAERPFPSLYLTTTSGKKIPALYGHGVDKSFQNSPALIGEVQTAMTYDGEYVHLYVNGVYVDKIESLAEPVSTLEAYLGDRPGNDRPYKGKIYNFMIYDRALESQEVVYNYEVYIRNKEIPIYTVSQLLKIGSNEVISINNVNYSMSPSANYKIMNDLSFSHSGIWHPNVSAAGRINSYDKVITIKNTNDNSSHYYQNQVYVTIDNAIKDGLVLHYDSINNTGSGHSDVATIWKDLNGTNDGILNNGPTWFSKGLSFDGIDDNVQFTGAITNNYSIVTTIKPVFTGTHPRIVSENPFPSIYLRSNKDYKVSFYGQGLDTEFYTPKILSATELNYIIVTYDSSVLTLYINGLKMGTLSTTTPPSSVPFAYLGDRSNNDRAYTGEIYDFMIYDRVLTEFEAERSYITNYSKYN